MPNPRKLFVLRKPMRDQVIGDVIDVLPSDSTGGENVDTENSVYVVITVSDLSEPVEKAFKDQRIRLQAPKPDDPFYAKLLPKGDGKSGRVTVKEETLMHYVEVI